MANVGDEVRQCLVNARQLLAREAAAHGAVGAHAEKGRIVVAHDLSKLDVDAHLAVEPELDAHALRISRRFSTTSFSSLKGGMPKVSSPPMRGWRSNTTGRTPLRVRMSAHARPAGPAPTTATHLPVARTLDMSGFQPCLNASSVMYFSIAPMVTAPRPSLSVQAPSHRRSCGQMRPHTSGSELVL